MYRLFILPLALKQAFFITLLFIAPLLINIASAATPKKILVLGDSLSSAYKIPKQKGWVYLLGKRVTPQWQVINGSVAGATTAHGLRLLPNLLKAHQPEWVALELGGNDGLQGKPIPYISRNLEKLITITKASGAKVVLIGIRLPPNFGPRYTQPFFQQYAALAKKHNIAYLPFLLEGVAGDTKLMMPDGIHPTAQAQPIILDNVWKIMKQKLH